MKPAEPSPAEHTNPDGGIKDAGIPDDPSPEGHPSSEESFKDGSSSNDNAVSDGNIDHLPVEMQRSSGCACTGGEGGDVWIGWLVLFLGLFSLRKTQRHRAS